MRAALRLLAICAGLWAVSFAIRHVFLADVMPVADAEEPQSTWALEAAFLLTAIENIALFGGAILIGIVIVGWFKGRARRPLSEGERSDLT